MRREEKQTGHIYLYLSLLLVLGGMFLGGMALYHLGRIEWQGWAKKYHAYQNQKKAQKSSLPLKKDPLPIPPFTYSYSIKNLAITLINKRSGQLSYLQLSLVFDCPSEECVHALELHRAAMIDKLYQVTNGLQKKELIDKEGKETLRKTLLTTYQHFFKDKSPRTLYFENWALN